MLAETSAAPSRLGGLAWDHKDLAWRLGGLGLRHGDLQLNAGSSGLSIEGARFLDNLIPYRHSSSFISPGTGQVTILDEEKRRKVESSKGDQWPGSGTSKV